MKGFKSTSANPYTYTQSGVWKKGQYTFQAIVKSDSGYAIAFQKPDLSWDVIDLSWQVQAGQYCSVLEAGFTLEYDAVAFRLIANNVTGEVVVFLPMLEQGANPSTPIAHEEDLRGMDGDFHEFIFTRNDTGIAPDAPLSTQEDDLEPTGWTDNPQGVTKELPFEYVSMREKKVGVWLDYSPPSLWAKWAEDGLSVYLRKQGHYESRWVGTEKVTDIVGGEMIGGTELIKVTAVFRKGEEDVAPTESLSWGFQWYVNGVHLPAFDDQHYITLDSTYGDGFADIVKLSYIVNSLREEIEVEVMNISAGMDGVGEEFIFKANNSGTVPPVLPKTTDAGYQDDDYHGDWSDDPVAPTELNQYVWVAKRQKVGGVWGAFGTPSLWTWWVTDGGDAAYWELHSSAPLIYKDAEDASTSGVHTTITLSGRYVEGVTSQNGGYISVQPNGGAEGTPLISPRVFTPPNNAGVDGYVIRLYDKVSKTTLLDTLTVPIAFKGGKGVSAINITLSNEADVLPASSDGVVTDYTGSGTTIRVFEGATELSYGTGNGQFQVIATGSGITVGTPSTSGKTRVYGVASNMTADNATITFTVTGKTASGASFSLTKVQTFAKSRTGQKGADGDGITSTTIHYAKSSSGTTIPTSWSTSRPTPTKGWYLWTRTTTVYKLSSNTVAYSISYWAEDGDDAADIRLTATNTQAVIGTNGVTPTQIKVTGTAKNTTISGWSYSVDGGSFTTPPNGVTRSGSVVTINTAVATWRTLAIKASNTTDNVDSVITISIVGYGAAGEKGKVPIVKEWLNSDTHLNNANVVDYIYYRPSRTWWKLKDAYTSRVATSSPSTTYYEQITYMGALATKVLIAEEANIANFVFKGGKLLSIAGTVGGSPATYTGQAGFVHNIVLDGQTGKIYAQDAEITGTVNATLGKVGGFDISGNSLVNAATDARISFNGLDGGQSFIRLNTATSMIAIRTDVNNKTGLSISTYAAGAIGLSITSNAGSALAIRSVGGHYFYQRSAEVWSSPGVLAAVELQYPSQNVYRTWAVHGVSASNAAFTTNGSVVTWTHNLGHTDYLVIPSSQATAGGVSVGANQSNSVSFTVSNHLANEMIYLLLIGRNKYVSL